MKAPAMEIFVAPNGTIQLLYTDELALTELGRQHVRRASHVEFDNAAQEWVATTPAGEVLGRFATRREALAHEVRVLNERIANGTIEGVFAP